MVGRARLDRDDLRAETGADSVPAVDAGDAASDEVPPGARAAS